MNELWLGGRPRDEDRWLRLGPRRPVDASTGTNYRWTPRLASKRTGATASLRCGVPNAFWKPLQQLTVKAGALCRRSGYYTVRFA